MWWELDGGVGCKAFMFLFQKEASIRFATASSTVSTPQNKAVEVELWLVRNNCNWLESFRKASGQGGGGVR